MNNEDLGINKIRDALKTPAIDNDCDFTIKPGDDGHYYIVTKSENGEEIVLQDLNYRESDAFKKALNFAMTSTIMGVDYNRWNDRIEISLFKDPTPEDPYRRKPIRIDLALYDLWDLLATKIYEKGLLEDNALPRN